MTIPEPISETSAERRKRHLPDSRPRRWENRPTTVNGWLQKLLDDPVYRANVEARFWPKVASTGDPNACWEWQGTRLYTMYGHGRFTLGTRGCCGSHRVAFVLASNAMPAANVCHRCDNPPCVNPAHLYDGTQKENVRDMFERGRANRPKRPSESNPRAKYTFAQAEEVRRLTALGWRRPAIVAKLRVSPHFVDGVRAGRFALPPLKTAL